MLFPIKISLSFPTYPPYSISHTGTPTLAVLEPSILLLYHIFIVHLTPPMSFTGLGASFREWGQACLARSVKLRDRLTSRVGFSSLMMCWRVFFAGIGSDDVWCSVIGLVVSVLYETTIEWKLAELELLDPCKTSAASNPDRWVPKYILSDRVGCRFPALLGNSCYSSNLQSLPLWTLPISAIWYYSPLKCVYLAVLLRPKALDKHSNFLCVWAKLLSVLTQEMLFPFSPQRRGMSKGTWKEWSFLKFPENKM